MNTEVRSLRGTSSITISSLLLVVLVFNVWFYNYGPMRHRIFSPHGLDERFDYTQEAFSDTAPAIETHTPSLPGTESFTFERGDTLYSVLNKASIAKNHISIIARELSKVHKLSALQAGQRLEIVYETADDNQINTGNRLIKSITFATRDADIIITRTGAANYKAQLIKAVLQEKQQVISGRISGSLYSAAVRSGASANMVNNFIKLFSYSTDFQRDLKSGDQFEMLSTYYVNKDGKRVREGDILYASLIIDGRKKSIYRYQHGANNFDYYDQHGNSIRKTLLRTPINGARVSSGFGMRQHPILGYSRMHKGLDYAASRGTPVEAAGDGVVQFIKNHPRGYGKHLTIKHNGKYTTLYAHLDRVPKHIKVGTPVKQGDVIAYVGSTGMSTGPHLHYEVLVMGKQVNPAKVSFAKSPPLKGKLLAAFQQKKDMIDKIIRKGG